jgi:hypothetical protein
MKIAKGNLLILTMGEYSDYSIGERFVALQDMDTREVEAAFKASGLYLDADGYADDWLDRFPKWMIDAGYVRLADRSKVQLWWIGSWLECEPDHDGGRQ